MDGIETLRKYGRPGPRYTSYPTAPNFTSSFGPVDYARALARAARSGRPLSLYVHVPFCESVCYFCACNVVYTQKRERVAPYLSLLRDEMDMVRAHLGPGPRVVQIHWGGGTPTFLAPAAIEGLMADIRERFEVAADAEVSIEIDPRAVSPAHLDAMARAGFNRASVGVQDLDPTVQQAVNRVQPIEVTESTIDGLRQRGVAGINVDLIYGLPHQTRTSFHRTLEAVIALRPDRVALFNFAYVPWLKPHQRAIDRDALPGAEQRLEIFGDAWSTFVASGYRHLGLDHFALPEDELSRAQQDGTLRRNFQGYSTRAAADLVGIGVTAIGEVGEAYAQNEKDLTAYERTIRSGHLATIRGRLLTPDDRIRRTVIMQLLSAFQLDMGSIGDRYGIDFERYFADALDALEPFVADGLLERGSDRIVRVAERGRFVIRNICMAFDAYLPTDLTAGQRFSQTV